MDRIEPGQHNEAIAEACISASEYLVWAAEMAATGRMADGSMARATLIKEARAKLDEAERIMHLSYRAAQHRRRPVAYLVAAE